MKFTFRKHKEAEVVSETPASCVELSIIGREKRHLADLRIAGLTEDSREFDAEFQLTSRAGTIHGTTGGNLYGHISSRASCDREVPLERVAKPSLEGMTSASPGKAGFAELRTGVYNNPVNSMCCLNCGEFNAHSFNRG
jgi:hypothetical protein